MRARHFAAAATAAITMTLMGCEALTTIQAETTPAYPETPAAGALRVAEPVDDGTYDRDAFGDGWADLDGDSCETRDEILARDLTDTVIEDGCDVKSGVLIGPYTGQRIDFTDSEAHEVHIDHIYPLAHAWRLGADQWPMEKRVRFANDPRNLLAADGPTNSSKGDAGPGEWVPLNRDYGCTYARKYARVARAYDLPVTRADLDSLRALRATC